MAAEWIERALASGDPAVLKAFEELGQLVLDLADREHAAAVAIVEAAFPRPRRWWRRRGR